MDPLVEAMFARVPPFRPEPDSASVLAALKVLQEAAQPVIVAGGGVRASGAGPELVALAERLGIPVATSLNGKDAIPGTHPLSVGVVGSYSRESANRVVSQADAVCFIGTETGGMTTHFWAVPKIGVPAVQIDIEPQALGRNYPLKAAVLGDAKVTLARMLAHLNEDTSARRKSWLEQAQSICRRVAREVRGRADLRRGSGAAGAHLLGADKAYPRGCHRGRRHRPCRHVDGRHARPQKPPPELTCAAPGIWAGRSPPASAPRARAPTVPSSCSPAIAGFYYHLAEVETAARWGINTVTVVNNNGGGNQSKRGFDRAYGGTQTDQARELWTYIDVNFAQVAENLGAMGLRVEKPSDFAPALQRALAASAP